MTKEIEELIRAARQVVGNTDDNDGEGRVAMALVDDLERAIHSYDLAQACAARKAVVSNVSEEGYENWRRLWDAGNVGWTTYDFVKCIRAFAAEIDAQKEVKS